MNVTLSEMSFKMSGTNRGVYRGVYRGGFGSSLLPSGLRGGKNPPLKIF